MFFDASALEILLACAQLPDASSLMLSESDGSLPDPENLPPASIVVQDILMTIDASEQQRQDRIMKAAMMSSPPSSTSPPSPYSASRSEFPQTSSSSPQSASSTFNSPPLHQTSVLILVKYRTMMTALKLFYDKNNDGTNQTNCGNGGFHVSTRPSRSVEAPEQPSNSQALQHDGPTVSMPKETKQPTDTPTVAPPTKRKKPVFKMPSQVGHFMRSIQAKRRDPCPMNTPNFIVVVCTLLLSWWLFQPWIGFFSFLFCVAPFIIHIVVYGVLGTDKVKARKSNSTIVVPEVSATTSGYSPDSLGLQTSTGDIHGGGNLLLKPAGGGELRSCLSSPSSAESRLVVRHDNSHPGRALPSLLGLQILISFLQQSELHKRLHHDENGTSAELSPTAKKKNRESEEEDGAPCEPHASPTIPWGTENMRTSQRKEEKESHLMNRGHPPARFLNGRIHDNPKRQFTEAQEAFIVKIDQDLTTLMVDLSRSAAALEAMTSEVITKKEKEKLLLKQFPEYKGCGDLSEFVYPLQDWNKVSDRDTISRFGVETKWSESKTRYALVRLAIWRVVQQVDDVFWHPMIDASLAVKYNLREGFWGQDKKNRPIYYFTPDPELLGRMIKDDKRDPESFVLWHIAVAEIGRHGQKFTGTDRGVAVVDLKNVGIAAVRHAGHMGIIKAWSKIDQQYFPESLDRIYVINVPRSMSIIWSILSLVLDEQIKSKIIFLKKNEDLYDHIDRNVLPKSVLPCAQGPDDFCTVGEILQNYRAGKGGDLLFKEHGGCF